jgi:hypothetical protein
LVGRVRAVRRGRSRCRSRRERGSEPCRSDIVQWHRPWRGGGPPVLKMYVLSSRGSLEAWRAVPGTWLQEVLLHIPVAQPPQAQGHRHGHQLESQPKADGRQPERAHHPCRLIHEAIMEQIAARPRRCQCSLVQ